jgi:uncharacterized membrane protein YgcG
MGHFACALKLGSSLGLGVSLLVLTNVASAQTPIKVDHSTLDIASIPKSNLDSARAITMSLEHASVGGNILDGMNDLDTQDHARYAFPNWQWHFRGNPGWQEKVDEFSAWVKDNQASFQVFMMKFCFIDDAADFDYYRDALLQLEKTYTTKKIIWWTMPIQSTGSSARNTFNGKVRTFCAQNNKPLFDIADIESHDPSGNSITDSVGEAMYGPYTDDGGHLNATGRIRAAEGIWWLMTRVSGWDVGSVDGGTGGSAGAGGSGGGAGSAGTGGSAGSGGAAGSGGTAGSGARRAQVERLDRAVLLGQMLERLDREARRVRAQAAQREQVDRRMLTPEPAMRARISWERRRMTAGVHSEGGLSVLEHRFPKIHAASLLRAFSNRSNTNRFLIVE